MTDVTQPGLQPDPIHVPGHGTIRAAETRTAPSDRFVGWLVRCDCGWQVGPVPRRAARAAMNEHSLSYEPIRPASGPHRVLTFENRGKDGHFAACACGWYAEHIATLPLAVKAYQEHRNEHEHYGEIVA